MSDDRSKVAGASSRTAGALTGVEEACLAGDEQRIACYFCAAVWELLGLAAHQQQRQRTPDAGLSTSVTVV
jgi:hypothetical protein